MGVKYRSTTLTPLQRSFERMYGLQLQQEGGGEEWIFSQAHAYMTHPPLGPQHPLPQHPQSQYPPAPQVALRLGDKRTKFAQSHQRLKTFPDEFAAKARKTLASLVLAMAKNSAYVRLSPSDAHRNAIQVQGESHEKQYPKSWWRPNLARPHEWDAVFWGVVRNP